MKLFKEMTYEERIFLEKYMETVDGMVKLLDEDATTFLDDSDKHDMFEELQNKVHILRNVYEVDV